MIARINRSGLVMAAVLALVSTGPAVGATDAGDEGEKSTVTRWTGSVPDDWKTTPSAAAVPAAPEAMEEKVEMAKPAPAEPAPAMEAKAEPATQMATAPAEPEPAPVAAAPAPAAESTGSSMAAITATSKGADPEWIRQQNAASEALRQEQLSRVGDAPEPSE